MDWNHDGREDGRDYIHYKSLIDTDSSSSGGSLLSDGSRGIKWVVIFLIVYVILKIAGCN